ncbi:hypothetical protein BaRGS_00000563 [Batillaria attramentaria]|uniref:Uncharacterized protein n=1 Tax=Batillaria attramentaria TaxID=370345 RepID=A0ABD0M8Z9_9CAEN
MQATGAPNSICRTWYWRFPKWSKTDRRRHRRVEDEILLALLGPFQCVRCRSSGMVGRSCVGARDSAMSFLCSLKQLGTPLTDFDSKNVAACSMHNYMGKRRRLFARGDGVWWCVLFVSISLPHFCRLPVFGKPLTHQSEILKSPLFRLKFAGISLIGNGRDMSRSFSRRQAYRVQVTPIAN